MTVQLDLDIPESLAELLNRTPATLGQEVKEAAICKWYEMGVLSQGRAAEVLGLSRSDLFEVFFRHQVSPFQETPEEIEGGLSLGV